MSITFAAVWINCATMHINVISCFGPCLCSNSAILTLASLLPLLFGSEKQVLSIFAFCGHCKEEQHTFLPCKYKYLYFI
uniref:Uncharacterized protein n=1 Tax=Octopus bimaculoides TaxID=37653 RepID=A0A0L8HH83_OCTBM